MVNSKSLHDDQWGKLVVMSLAFMVLATVYLFFVLGVAVRLVDGGGSWLVFGHHLEKGELFEATRNAVAFAAFTIAGGAAYLAYRRQRATDRTTALMSSRHDADSLGDLRARFTTAVEQLAHSSATVRIAGVYSLAAIADQWLERRDQEQAQVTVGVLCGYMRLPYSPDLGSNHQTKQVVKQGPSDTADAVEDHFEYLQNDRVVRTTITGVLASKTRGSTSEAVPGPWSTMELNLAGAHLVDADFRTCYFDAPVNFTGAHFEGVTWFSDARWKKSVVFDLCWFDDNERLIFASAKFDGRASFNESRFSPFTMFNNTTFADRVELGGSWFGMFTTFDNATFMKHVGASGIQVPGRIAFDDATFDAGADFTSAIVANGSVSFVGAHLRPPMVFDETRFQAGESPHDYTNWCDPGAADLSNVVWLEELSPQSELDDLMG